MFSHRSVVRGLLQEVRKEILRARAPAPQRGIGLRYPYGYYREAVGPICVVWVPRPHTRRMTLWAVPVRVAYPFRGKERLRIDGTSIFIIAAISYDIISEWRYNSEREERRKSREIALNPKKEHSSSGD